MRPEKVNAHAEHRRRENQRVDDSDTLANTFPQLKGLKLDLAYYSSDNETRSSHMKYTVNLHSARSLFRFDCPNQECVRGDFDLSNELKAAVATRRKTLAGEKCCQGWLSDITVDAVRCRKVLRYQVTLVYK